MKVTIAVVLSIALLLAVPFESLAYQASQGGRPPVAVPPRTVQCDVCAAHGLSKAVVLGTFVTLHQFHAKLKAGEARSADARASLTSLRILFADLDETGATKAMEKSILAKEQEIIKYTPTRTDAKRLVERHHAFGVDHTVEQQVQQLENSTVNDRVKFLDEVKTSGIRGALYAKILARYEDLETRMSKAERSGKSFQYREASVQDCDVLSQSASVMAVACVFGCEPCCIVAAILYLEFEMCKVREANEYHWQGH